MGDTETRSAPNAGSPIQEPPNRHTPSQDSCCSNDTLFNLEDLTYALTENENTKMNNDLTERKCDETTKDVIVDLINCKDYTEEPTLKIEDHENTNNNKQIEQNVTEGLHNEKKKDANEEGLFKGKENNKCTLKTEIFTCNFEPTVNIDYVNKEEKQNLVSFSLEERVDGKMLIENCATSDIHEFTNHNSEEKDGIILEQNKNDMEIEKNKINIEKTIANEENKIECEEFIKHNDIDEKENATNCREKRDVVIAENEDLIGVDEINTSVDLELVNDKINELNIDINLDTNKIENQNKVENSIDIIDNKEQKEDEMCNLENTNSKININISQDFIDNEIINENKIRTDNTQNHKVEMKSEELKAIKVEENLEEFIDFIKEEVEDLVPDKEESNISLNKSTDDCKMQIEVISNSDESREANDIEHLDNIDLKFTPENDESTKNVEFITESNTINEEKEQLVNSQDTENDEKVDTLVDILSIEEIDSKIKEIGENTENSNETNLILPVNHLDELNNLENQNAKNEEVKDDYNEDKIEIDPFSYNSTNILTTDLEIQTKKFEENIKDFNSLEEINEQKNLSEAIDKCDNIDNLNIDKINIKNIQNGSTSPKWIEEKEDIKSSTNENDVNLINVLDKFDNSDSKIIDKTLVDAKDNKIEQNESNKHYLTEFLNHERQNSISSLGSSKDDDSSSSFHNNQNFSTENEYANVDDIHMELNKDSQSSDPPSYVNVTKSFNSHSEYVNVMQRNDTEEHLYDPVAEDSADMDIYDALSDIRFSGPSDIQLMSTSFSESADIDEEQDWDSGSDTRSSSSGEFIWKVCQDFFLKHNLL